MEDSRIDIVAEVVSAYVSNNSVPATDLPNLIAAVHASFTRIANGEPVEEAPPRLVPAVPVKKSIGPDFIVCLEDGRALKSLKRHLNARYGLTPDEYRAKWGLPPDYPMVAPSYAQARSDLAKQMGLGQARRKVPAKKVTKGR